MKLLARAAMQNALALKLLTDAPNEGVHKGLNVSFDYSQHPWSPVLALKR